MVKKILSIDGGGMYGVVPLAVCIAIENRLGEQLKDTFDLFVGTSTGALIVSAALRGIVKDRTEPENKEKERKTKGFGIKTEDILQIYYDQAEVIFGEGARRRSQFNIPILDVNKYPKYRADGLKKVVGDVFGSGDLTKIRRAEKPLSISAYNVSSREPHFFRSWQGEYQDLEIGDAVMASASVPTTHPLYKIKDDYYTDGGVFATSPGMFALMDALSMFGNEELILVSLGTGISPHERKQEETPEDTALWWL